MKKVCAPPSSFQSLIYQSKSTRVSVPYPPDIRFVLQLIFDIGIIRSKPNFFPTERSDCLRYVLQTLLFHGTIAPSSLPLCFIRYYKIWIKLHLYPKTCQKKALHEKIFEKIRQDGYSKVRVHGQILNLSDEMDPS